MPEELVKTHRSPSLPLFTCLEFPYGIVSTISVVVTMYLLRNAGFTIAQTSAIASLTLLPSTLYFLYAPVTDFFFGRRSWYLIALALTAALGAGAILASGSQHLHVVTAILFFYVVCGMLIGASTGGLMSTLLPQAGQKKVGTWTQLGANALSGFAFALVIYLTTRCSLGALAVVSITLMLPGLAVLRLREPVRESSHEPFSVTLRAFGQELLNLFRSRKNILCFVLLLSPVSAMGFGNILTGLAPEYHATATQLAFANGWGGSVFVALGAFSLLLVPASWHRLIPYLLGGLVSAAVSFFIAACPVTPRSFIVGSLAINFAIGVCYSATTALVLYVSGEGGKRQSTRYALINSLSNVSLMYMIAIEGAVAGRHGPRFAASVDGVASGSVAIAAALLLQSGRRHLTLDPVSLPQRS